jgi:hypothetical protein
LAENEFKSLFRAAVIENTFTNIQAMARTRFSLMRAFPVFSRLLTMKWNNLEKIHHCQTPIFFVGGDRDTFVPVEMT